MNPYKVLGVSETATPEEIRQAYLELVKKYHPDKYTDNPLKELANEKLKEINEAYDTLTKKDKSSSASSSGGYSGYSGAPEAHIREAAPTPALKLRSFRGRGHLYPRETSRRPSWCLTR